MSNINPLEQAAIPSAVAVLQAVKQLVANLGTDPAQIAIKFPGALQVFLGSVELQAPALVNTEIGAVQGVVGTAIDGWISKLQAAKTA